MAPSILYGSLPLSIIHQIEHNHNKYLPLDKTSNRRDILHVCPLASYLLPLASYLLPLASYFLCVIRFPSFSKGGGGVVCNWLNISCLVICANFITHFYQ